MILLLFTVSQLGNVLRQRIFAVLTANNISYQVKIQSLQIKKFGLGLRTRKTLALAPGIVTGQFLHSHQHQLVDSYVTKRGVLTGPVWHSSDIQEDGTTHPGDAGSRASM